jgi:hypothetical protein
MSIDQIALTASAVLGGLVAVLAAIAPLTPTPVDDAVLTVAQKVLLFFSGLFEPRKGTGGAPVVDQAPKTPPKGRGL